MGGRRKETEKIYENQREVEELEQSVGKLDHGAVYSLLGGWLLSLSCLFLLSHFDIVFSLNFVFFSFSSQ